MNDHSRTVVGLDVHKETIVGFSLLPNGIVDQRFQLQNRPEPVEKMVIALKKRHGMMEFVYEAGPCGFELYRQLMKEGQACFVVAPSLIPRRPGDHVKTDRRDAEKLARMWRAGEMRAISVPSQEQEAARDLVRTREDALEDRCRARQRVSSFLLRQGRVWGQTTWKKGYWVWLKAQRFEYPALQMAFDAHVRQVEDLEEQLKIIEREMQDLIEQEPYKTRVKFLSAMKGIDHLTALTLSVETPDFERFPKARAYMSYTGMIVREYSSGPSVRRGGITKVGNAHIRRVLVESAWGYRHKSRMSRILNKRREGCPPGVIQIARRAEERLHRKYWRLVNRGKASQEAVVAVARELSGFIWAMAKEFPKVA